MWFNSKQRAEPYQPLTCPGPDSRDGSSFGAGNTGAAWLSSARVVRCWVKSRNERNPRLSCHHSVGHSKGTAGDKPEEGGDDVKSSWPLRAGLHTCYNGGDSGMLRSRGGANLKKPSQFGLHSATRVHEVGIASNRGSACRGEYVPGPCTHRPSHHGSWFYPKAVR
jgi:hypothetical protein